MKTNKKTTKKSTKKSTAHKIAPIIRRRAVSLATLDGLHACFAQQKRFTESFGTSRREHVQITAENIQIARSNGLNIDWLLYRVIGRVAALRPYNASRRAIHTRYMQGKITMDQKDEKINELTAKVLREHWGEDM